MVILTAHPANKRTKYRMCTDLRFSVMDEPFNIDHRAAIQAAWCT